MGGVFAGVRVIELAQYVYVPGAGVMLADQGARVQYSVFECDLDDKALRRLKARLKGEIDARADSVRFYALCEADVRRIGVMGRGGVVRKYERE